MKTSFLQSRFTTECCHLILPASVVDGQRKDLEDKLRFILARSLTFDTAEDDELKQLVDLHYVAVNTTFRIAILPFKTAARCDGRTSNQQIPLNNGGVQSVANRDVLLVQ